MRYRSADSNNRRDPQVPKRPNSPVRTARGLVSFVSRAMSPRKSVIVAVASVEVVTVSIQVVAEAVMAGEELGERQSHQEESQGVQITFIPRLWS